MDVVHVQKVRGDRLGILFNVDDLPPVARELFGRDLVPVSCPRSCPAVVVVAALEEDGRREEDELRVVTSAVARLERVRPDAEDPVEFCSPLWHGQTVASERVRALSPHVSFARSRA